MNFLLQIKMLHDLAWKAISVSLHFDVHLKLPHILSKKQASSKTYSSSPLSNLLLPLPSSPFLTPSPFVAGD